MGSAYYTGMRTGMRLAGLVLLAAVPAFGQTAAQPIGTMSDLMVKIIYPSSDAIFYITTRTPASEAEWGELQGKALAVAESANLPWGAHPAGSIVVDRGACYVQIMSTDTPSFAAGGAPPTDQMKTALTSTYITYSGPCVVDAAAGSVTLKVDAAWRPDYVGTEQKRFYRFENGRLIFGPAPNTMRGGTETLTRRLTLERVP